MLRQPLTKTDKRVLTLAYPIILANVSIPLLGLTDTAVIGHLDNLDVLAGISMGAVLMGSIYWFFGFLRMGITGLVAQARGSNQNVEVSSILLRGLIIAGIGGFGDGLGYLMAPLNYDLQVIQQIEMNQMIRMNNYSFEIRADKLRIFPIPNFNNIPSGSTGPQIWFEYILRDERIATSVKQTPDRVTNVSNAPYENPTYEFINSVGRQWIFEYTLALAKEMLGYVRGKYSTIPIPDSSVTLNQSDLLSAATAEKGALIERLRAYLDETSRDKLLERRANENDFLQKELNKVPYTIYIA